jgi:class 3 adenylate cyclase
MDLLWDEASVIRVVKRLSRFCRTLWFEARGWGASEGDRLDADVGKVFDADLFSMLDAAGAGQPALLGAGPTGSAAIRFSARHPDRVSALVLFNAHAHYVQEDDYPWGFAREDLDWVEAFIRDLWDRGATEVLAPSQSTGERARVERVARVGGSPNQVARAMRADFERDHRRLLPTISVPTLVLHREQNRVIRLGAGRFVADHIPNAKFVVLPGDEYPLLQGDTDRVLDEIEEFLTGARSSAEGDVVLAAVLFTDIVASTEHQARVGTREWSRLTDHHDAMVRAALARHRGHEVKTTGDGFLITFQTTGGALRCAGEIVAAAKGIGLELRAGIHTGEVEVRGDDIAGLAVSIARRVCDEAASGEVLVSRTTADIATGSGIAFIDRGDHELKGVPGLWHLVALET